jgi:type I restriction enzyme R subunit
VYAAVARVGDLDQGVEHVERHRLDAVAGRSTDPKIAVTVDLLTTGIDVPSITNLVFIRRVNSRILYDQMIGRATRPCPEIGKEVFRSPP